MAELLHPVYFPNCLTLSRVARAEVVWEVWDNYQKQTYRNRCYICTDQGKQMLNLPIRHTGGTSGRQRYRDVCLDNTYNWQRQHWRGLQTAYRSAPFFEFYEADLLPLFESRFDRLLELNLATVEILCKLLGLEFPVRKTEKYEAAPTGVADLRFLVDAKSEIPAELPPYPQVFTQRHGFIPNVSALDLLFNEGPATRDYLMQVQLNG
ncbi:WbqC family protein [Robiginitalea sp. SC105]|uniref:WbqC family protein n=1 Tax=Robiginitalea sp. SC105 TaxID=2762332 RepID=UPI00163A2A62|nr:WbqC family protein [Robiginitalea sp. SC105]MBC2839237.1 WbqC family protein [Robiginitalea sp. SC105]